MRIRKRRLRFMAFRFGMFGVTAILLLSAFIFGESPPIQTGTHEATFNAQPRTEYLLPQAPPPSVVYTAVARPATESIPELEPETIPEPEPEFTYLGTFRLTAYCHCVICCEIWSAEHPSRIGTDFVQRTASGTIPTAGRTIAVDTGVIPFGTVVRINGQYYVAEDRGGAIRGNSIDIFFDTHQEALNFGRQTASVYIKNY